MDKLVAWFARNTVAANMLMFGIVAIGLLVLQKTPKEILPPLEPEKISITAQLNNASLAQVEQQLCAPIEKALAHLDNIQQIRATASHGACLLILDLAFNSDVNATLNQVDELMRLIPLPPEAQPPIVQRSLLDVMVARIALTGDASYQTLVELAEQVQADLTALGLSKVILRDQIENPVNIVVSEAKLQQFQLSFAELAQALANNSRVIAVGVLQSDEARATITLNNTHPSAQALAEQPIRSFPDGSRIILADVAEIHYQTADQQLKNRVNGKPAVSISIYQDNKHDITAITDIIYRYMEQRALPDGVQLLMLQDNSRFFKDRMQMLKGNAISGLILVFLVLFLFLRTRLAFWVTAGIPMAFLGGFIVLYLADGSINMVSTFGILVVLGIVTDDTIIVGENIHRHFNMGKTGLQAAIDGTNEMVLPVFIAVLTTAITFLPLAFLPGIEGQVLSQVPLIVVAILIFSLIECFFVLPAHLSHIKASQRGEKIGLQTIERINQWIFSAYQRLLMKALHWRYACLLFFVGMLIICLSLVAAGWMKINFRFSAETEIATAVVAFPEGSRQQLTIDAIAQMEQAALQLKTELQQQYQQPQISHIRTQINENSGIIFMNLAATQQRQISGEQLMQQWRSRTGAIAEASHLNFSAHIGDFQANQIRIDLTANDIEQLTAASSSLKLALQTASGVHQVRDSLLNAQQDIQIQLNDTAFELGLNQELIATQVKAAFSGVKLPPLVQNHRIIPVQLSLAENERNSLWHLENLPIRLLDGSIVPLFTLATLQSQSSANQATRINGQRIVSLYVEFDPSSIARSDLNRFVAQQLLPQLQQQYPHVTLTDIDDNRMESILKERMWLGFSVALLVMYVIMAMLFASYLQPLLILTAVPFGLVGAILGHVLLGIELTYLSLAGMIAVSGIVINDEVVMLHYANERMKEGKSLYQAISTAGVDRFLAVFLTSATTFFGLLPIMAETSFETQFLIPLAVSIAFGVMFSTLVTLIFLPCLHLVCDDIHRWFSQVFLTKKTT